MAVRMALRCSGAMASTGLGNPWSVMTPSAEWIAPIASVVSTLVDAAPAEEAARARARGSARRERRRKVLRTAFSFQRPAAAGSMAVLPILVQVRRETFRPDGGGGFPS